MFPFQSHVVAWALDKQRCAIFADCGLGKTLMQIEWARSVATRTNMPVIILAPLAVAAQTVREGVRFGIPVEYAPTPDARKGAPIVVTNYERLPRWRDVIGDFAGVVLDESSILKAFMGQTRNDIIKAFCATPYRLACTATPSPNDHTELGNHSEFLGVLPRADMLARWFVNDLSQPIDPWRLKRHAVTPFWEWVTSWAVCASRPSDIGNYDDSMYMLPALTTPQSVVDVDITEGRQGTLFRMQGASATGINAERKITAPFRADRVAALVASEPAEPWLIWCDTNFDADAIRARIPEAVEVRGDATVEEKEAKLMGFVDGAVRVLITKPRIAGFGLNFQHCARIVFAGATYSFEQWYQAVRRCWRFGQARRVDAHMVCGSTEVHVIDALSRKRREHELMQREMFAAARRAQRGEVRNGTYNPTRDARLPAFLQRT